MPHQLSIPGKLLGYHYTDRKEKHIGLLRLWDPTSWIVKVEDLTDIVQKNDICIPDVVFTINDDGD